MKRTFYLTIAAFFIHAGLVARYIVSVDTPNNGTQTRSIGYRVDPTIPGEFPGKNDEELLRIGGLEEWQIEKVWAPARLGRFGWVFWIPIH